MRVLDEARPGDEIVGAGRLVEREEGVAHRRHAARDPLHRRDRPPAAPAAAAVEEAVEHADGRRAAARLGSSTMTSRAKGSVLTTRTSPMPDGLNASSGARSPRLKMPSGPGSPSGAASARAAPASAVVPFHHGGIGDSSPCGSTARG